MKKFIGLLLAIIMPLSFAACAPDVEGLSVFMPDGATALSLSYMMEHHQEIDGEEVNYNVVPPASIPSYAQNKEADLIVLPVNAAINLHKKGAPYSLAAVVTHGNLFIIGKEASSLQDLKGSVVASIGQGNIPQLVFTSILSQNDIEYEEGVEAVAGKVVINYASDGSDVIRMLKAKEADFGMIAEPAVTNAINNPNLDVIEIFNLQDEWETLTGKNIYPQAALLVKDGTDKDLVNKFLQLMQDNDGWAQENPEAAVAAVKANALEGTESSITALSADIIQRSNILTVTADLEAYIEDFLVLVGLGMPSEGFYYTKA